MVYQPRMARIGDVLIPLARDTAWRDFAAKSKRNAELLKLAEAVS